MEPPRFIGYLGTDWKSSDRKAEKPKDLKVWCFHFIPEAAVREYAATRKWNWRGLDKEAMGPFLCVPLPREGDEELIAPQPGQSQAIAPRKRPTSAPSLDQIADDFVRLLKAEHGFLSQAAARGLGGAGHDAAAADLRGEVRAQLQAMVAGLRREQERWPDYVFEEGFVVPNLEAVLAFARAEGHLPGVVPAARADAGDFEARREVASVLRHVEISLLWLNDNAEQIRACAARCEAVLHRVAALEERSGGGGGAAGEEEGADDQGDGAAARLEVLRLLDDRRQGELELRPYQAACLAACLDRNTIVSLPTGCGKTLVAVRAIDAYAAREPGRRVAVVVPKRALVPQQAGYVREHGARRWRVAELCGMAMEGWGPGDWGACLRDSDVLVGTPEVFRRALVDLGCLPVARLSLLVLDECHNATGNSPMAAIMRDAVHRAPPAERSRVVGLTASFVNGRLGDVVGKRQALEALLLADLVCPAVPSEAGPGAAAPPGGPEFTEMRYVRQPDEERLARLGGERVAALLGRPAVADLLAITNAGKVARDAAHVLVEAGREAFLYYVGEGLLPSLQAKAEAFDAADDGRLRAKAQALLRALPRLRAELRDGARALRGDGGLAAAAAAVSPKAAMLRGLVRDLFAARPRGKGIVFVEQIALAFPLAHLLSRPWPGGGGPAAAAPAVAAVVGGGCMSDAEREAALGRFRAGGVRVLVSTCALEEGIHVADCDFVVRYSRFATTRSHIQGSGRARAAGARVFYFENDPAQEQAGAAALARAARDPTLGLGPAEREARAAARPPAGPHPYRPDGEGEVSIYTALGIFMAYCSRVLRQSVGKPQLCTYEEPAAAGGRRTLVEVRYPGPEGMGAVGRGEVAALWGDTDMARVVDPARWGPGRTAAELDEARFFFAVAVALRRRGLLGPDNRPSPAALARSRASCPALPTPPGSRLAPKFSAAGLRPPPVAPAAAACASPDPPPRGHGGPSPPGPASPGSPGAGPSAPGRGDFKSELNVLGHALWRRGNAVRYAVAGAGPFVATVTVGAAGASYTGAARGSKREAEQSAAEAAVRALQPRQAALTA